MNQSVIGKFDALQTNLLFCFWTGPNELSEQRREALYSIVSTTDCPVLLVREHAIRDWELRSSPYHPAYEYLSETHKADYLRCYFMHHYGGGYTDIKQTSVSWREAFHQLRSSNALGIGYQEVAPESVAPVGGSLEIELRENFRSLIGNGAYIFRPYSAFTKQWIEETHVFLDGKMEELRLNPARHPRDQSGASFSDGTESCYPIGWTEMLGNIFHPLVYEFRHVILQANLAPSFSHYR